jgi:hypothetical protein
MIWLWKGDDLNGKGIRKREEGKMKVKAREYDWNLYIYIYIYIYESSIMKLTKNCFERGEEVV